MKNSANFKKILKFVAAVWFITTKMVSAQEKPVMHQLVQEVAENYVLQNATYDEFSEINISVRELDERVQVPACPVDLVANSSEQSLKQSNITVKVSCPSNGWFHYISAKIIELQEVVVVTDTTAPGTVLTKEHLKVIKMDKKRLRGGTFADKESLVGARLKRRTRMGNPITPRMLCFVCKGDSIVITAKLSGLEIKTGGIAQQDGNLGDTITVKNKRSKKLIEAEVANIREVRVQI